MKVLHVGYARKSRRGGAVKIDLALEPLLMADRYTGRDGKEYIGLVVRASCLEEVLQGRKEVTGIQQLGAEKQ